MSFKECNHIPHVTKITFDVGNNQTTTYELCKNCQKLEVFSENIVNIEEIGNE